MSIQIITPEERLAELRGVHALITGVFGIGKTSLLRTLDPETTLFINVENGDLAVHDVAVPHIRPQTWQELRDLIVKIAGPNPSFGKNEAFSQAHFRSRRRIPAGHRELSDDLFRYRERGDAPLFPLGIRAAGGRHRARQGRPALGVRLARARTPAGATSSAKRPKPQRHPDQCAGNRHR